MNDRRIVFALMVVATLAACSRSGVLVAPDDDPVGETDTDEPTSDTDTACSGFTDADGDGFAGTATDDCDAIVSEEQTDCDDADSGVFPGAFDALCDGVDADCDDFGLEIAVLDGAAYGTLTAALAVAETGDEILVCPGTHLVQPAAHGTHLNDVTIASWSGDAADTRLEAPPGGGILQGGGTITLRDLTFGDAALAPVSDASCVDWSGALAIERVTVDGCASGGIWAAVDELLVTDSVFRGGDDGPPLWGAIDDGVMSVSDSTFEDNAGYSLFLSTNDATVIVKNSVFEGNSSLEVWLAGDSLLDVVGSTFVGNDDSAISVDIGGRTAATVAVEGCTFEGNQGVRGGALYLDSVPETSSLEATVRNSVFSGNTAEQGGAVGAGGPYVSPDGPMALSFEDVRFTGNASSGICSAVVVYGATAGDQVSFDGVVIEDGTTGTDSDGENLGCAVGLVQGTFASSWRDVDLRRNDAGNRSALDFLWGFEGSTVTIEDVRFGTGADENRGSDLAGCLTEHLGTVSSASLPDPDWCP